jgi:mannose-6-phosphate isomerase-like protein (cupin superfamily)
MSADERGRAYEAGTGTDERVVCERLHAADGLELFAARVPANGVWQPGRHGAAYGYVAGGSATLAWGVDPAARVAVDADEFFRVPAGTPPVVEARNGPARLLVAVDSGVTGAADADWPSATADGRLVTTAADGGGVSSGGEPQTVTPTPRARSSTERPAARAAATTVAGRDDWGAAGELENVERRSPFPDDDVRMVRGHSSGEIVSEWHHHRDNHVFGFVLAGDGYVEWGTGEGERLFVAAGECFHIPAGFVHRDRSDSAGDQEFVLWLTGSEPRTLPAEETNR